MFLHHIHIYDSMIFPHLCSDVDQETSRLLKVDIFNNIIYCRPGDRSTVDSWHIQEQYFVDWGTGWRLATFHGKCKLSTHSSVDIRRFSVTESTVDRGTGWQLKLTMEKWRPNYYFPITSFCIETTYPYNGVDPAVNIQLYYLFNGYC